MDIVDLKKPSKDHKDQLEIVNYREEALELASHPLHYFVHKEGQEVQGPYTLAQIRTMWESGWITLDCSYTNERHTEPMPIEELVGKEEERARKIFSPERVSRHEVQPDDVVLILFLGIFGVHRLHAGAFLSGLIQMFLGFVVVGYHVNLLADVEWTRFYFEKLHMPFSIFLYVWLVIDLAHILSGTFHEEEEEV